MMNKIINILKIIAMAGVIIVAFLFVLLVVDVFTVNEIQEGLLKVAQIAGIIAIASIVVIFISKSR